MIQAILSRVFVVYLYQKLNGENLGSNANAISNIGSEGLIESRLYKIESRLEQLAKQSKS